jgi:ubiquinone/menaquinone biosynthesis C-methylase UbiE
MKKLIVAIIKKLDILSAVSCRLTKLTRKSKYPIHPKHLVKSKIWFINSLNKDDQILDLGCGVGTSLLSISKKVKFVTGVDHDSASIEVATKKAKDLKINNISFQELDVNKGLPFKDRFFDGIICSDILEHLKKRSYILKEITRVLKPRGKLYLVVDNPDTTWKKLQKEVGLFYYADPDHKYEYPKEEILKLLEKLNYKILLTDVVTYDTPIKGVIDLIGGFSLTIYKRLRSWKEMMVRKYPHETTGFRIIAQKSL